MATFIDYVDSDDLKSTLKLDGTSLRDEDIAQAVTSASRAIDDALNRYFGKSAEADVVRFYTPERRLVLEIDDVIDLTAVDIDTGDGAFSESWTENTDFFLEPLNAATDGRPWERLVLDPARGKRLPARPRSVRITAQFGWDEVPAGVVEYCGILAKRLLRRATEAETDVSTSIATVALEVGAALRLLRTDPEAGTLLDGLSREVFLA
jgi:hypothetical protein